MYTVVFRHNVIAELTNYNPTLKITFQLTHFVEVSALLLWSGTKLSLRCAWIFINALHIGNEYILVKGFSATEKSPPSPK